MRKKTMLVSIVTPLHNAKQFIAQTVASVLAQSYREWEMLVVDDGSTDGSFDILTSYALKDNRIKPIRLGKNMGPAVARNRAIEIATGRYIAFLDSDDLWKAQKLSKQVAFMRECGHALTYTFYDKIDDAGGAISKTVCPPQKLSYADMLKSNYIGCLTAMYDTKKLGKVYMPEIVKRQDYGLWLKILKQEKYAHCLPEILATYRVRGNSLSSSKLSLIKYNWKLFREVEHLSAFESARYVCWNVFKKILG